MTGLCPVSGPSCAECATSAVTPGSGRAPDAPGARRSSARLVAPSSTLPRAPRFPAPLNGSARPPPEGDFDVWSVSAALTTDSDQTSGTAGARRSCGPAGAGRAVGFGFTTKSRACGCACAGATLSVNATGAGATLSAGATPGAGAASSAGAAPSAGAVFGAGAISGVGALPSAGVASSAGATGPGSSDCSAGPGPARPGPACGGAGLASAAGNRPSRRLAARLARCVVPVALGCTEITAGDTSPAPAGVLLAACGVGGMTCPVLPNAPGLPVPLGAAGAMASS